MLPPIQISQSSVAFQVRRPDETDDTRSGQVISQSVDTDNIGLDVRSAIAGRVSILLLSGPERAADSFAIMAELFGRSLGVPRTEGETQADYMRRLADALNALPPSKRLIVEQQLAQLFNGLALKTVIAAFTDPAGPEAAIMTMHLEVADGGDDQRFSNSAFLSYGSDPEEAAAPLRSSRQSAYLPQAAANGDTMHLKIVGLAERMASPGGGRNPDPVLPVAGSRPMIDIRGTNEGSATASVPFQNTERNPSSWVSARPIPQVTIDISTRPVVAAEQETATGLRQNGITNNWSSDRPLPASGPHAPEREQITSRQIATGIPETEETGNEPAKRQRAEIAAIDAGWQARMLPPVAIGEEGDIGDAITKILHSSLLAAYQPSVEDTPPRLSPEGRDSGIAAKQQTGGDTGANTVSDPEPTRPAETAIARQPERTAAAASELQNSLRLDPGPVVARDPIGFPSVGYPYLDDEEADIRRDRRAYPTNDEDENSETPDDQQSFSQDSSDDDQSEENVATTPFSEQEADVEPAISSQAGGRDSAHDLYLRMAGWA